MWLFAKTKAGAQPDFFLSKRAFWAISHRRLQRMHAPPFKEVARSGVSMYTTICRGARAPRICDPRTESDKRAQWKKSNATQANGLQVKSGYYVTLCVGFKECLRILWLPWGALCSPLEKNRAKRLGHALLAC